MNKETKILIQSVLLKDKEQVIIGYIPPNEVIDFMKEHDFELKEDWETNGWDHDFWMYFYKDETEYMFSGSWYYGTYTFGLDPDRDAD